MASTARPRGCAARPRASHGLEIEERFGYAQATQAGAMIYVAGQVPRDADGNAIRETGLERKLGRAIANTEAALHQLDCTLDDLVAVNMHVVEGAESVVGEAAALCRLHLGAARPATTLVRATTLNNPEYLVEVSAVALAPASANGGQTVKRVNVNTGSPAEERLGRSDAVRVGNTVYIAGQPSWQTAGQDFPTQYRDAIEQFVAVAEAAGATRDDVVEMHVYVTEMPGADDWNTVIDVHHELFGTGVNRPASTMIGVSSLSAEGAAVEISGVAVVDS